MQSSSSWPCRSSQSARGVAQRGGGASGVAQRGGGASGVARLLLLFLALLASSLLPSAGANIAATSYDNRSREDFADLAALFGYIPPAGEGLRGALVPAWPEDACEPLVPAPAPRGFVALIRGSGGCNFDVKVLNAQRAGFEAAVVHNVRSNVLLRMRCSWDALAWARVTIPAVFVSQDTAEALRRSYTFEKGGRVTLTTDAGQAVVVVLGKTGIVTLAAYFTLGLWNLRTNLRHVHDRYPRLTVCVVMVYVVCVMGHVVIVFVDQLTIGNWPEEATSIALTPPPLESISVDLDSI